MKRENPRSIIALTYNRHAAVEIRKRLKELIGRDAIGVMVLTCHSLAMRLAGYSFANLHEKPDKVDFEKVLHDAIKLLQGDGLPDDDAMEQRERLIMGFRWILVDEYQDVGPDQYALISALAGRTHPDADGKLSLFAVGDDDQNVYGFIGANLKYIRQFKQDYQAREEYLTENYRSTKNIIEAANAVIAHSPERMKTTEAIRIDRKRNSQAGGGTWAAIDRVARGEVQILPATDAFTQARHAVAELQRFGNPCTH